jgi:ketol-acid reductoisomerase
MKGILSDIQDGTFAKRFIADQDNGAKEFQELREKEASHSIETVGRELRQMFSWNKDALDDDYTEGTAAR